MAPTTSEEGLVHPPARAHGVQPTGWAEPDRPDGAAVSRARDECPRPHGPRRDVRGGRFLLGLQGSGHQPHPGVRGLPGARLAHLPHRRGPQSVPPDAARARQHRLQQPHPAGDALAPGRLLLQAARRPRPAQPLPRTASSPSPAASAASSPSSRWPAASRRRAPPSTGSARSTGRTSTWSCSATTASRTSTASTPRSSSCTGRWAFPWPPPTTFIMSTSTTPPCRTSASASPPTPPSTTRSASRCPASPST